MAGQKEEAPDRTDVSGTEGPMDLTTKHNPFRRILEERKVRINVYQEEMTSEVKLIATTVPDTGNTYYGVRVFMKSPPELHTAEDDDDRTAITYWFSERARAESLHSSMKMILSGVNP